MRNIVVFAALTILCCNSHSEISHENQLIPESSIEEEIKTEKISAKKYEKPPKSKMNYVPPEGYVPDEKTAIAIAVAVWSAIYGEEKIVGEKPYIAKLEEGIWHIEGSLPRGWAGGVAEAEISKADGKILRVIHGK